MAPSLELGVIPRNTLEGCVTPLKTKKNDSEKYGSDPRSQIPDLESHQTSDPISFFKNLFGEMIDFSPFRSAALRYTT